MLIQDHVLFIFLTNNVSINTVTWFYQWQYTWNQAKTSCLNNPNGNTDLILAHREANETDTLDGLSSQELEFGVGGVLYNVLQGRHEPGNGVQVKNHP